MSDKDYRLFIQYTAKAASTTPLTVPKVYIYIYNMLCSGFRHIKQQPEEICISCDEQNSCKRRKHEK